jgi:hypothetical protein
LGLARPEGVPDVAEESCHSRSKDSWKLIILSSQQHDRIFASTLIGIILHFSCCHIALIVHYHIRPIHPRTCLISTRGAVQSIRWNDTCQKLIAEITERFYVQTTQHQVIFSASFADSRTLPISSSKLD